MFVLQLMDSYSATVSVMTIGVLECVVVAWIYSKYVAVRSGNIYKLT